MSSSVSAAVVINVVGLWLAFNAGLLVGVVYETLASRKQAQCLDELICEHALKLSRSRDRSDTKA
jgi:xanthosine utilization system XapX-like protein